MRSLYPTPRFERMHADFIRQNPTLIGKLNKVLKQLQAKALHPGLKVHKLHGEMKDMYAARVSFDKRIVFRLTNKLVILIAIGSHDELYR